MNTNTMAFCCAAAIGWAITFCNTDASLGQSHTVAVLDVARVFKEDKTFQVELEQLREEIQQAREELGNDSKKKLLAFQEEMMQKEADLYSETYQRMQKVVEEIAEMHDIALVVRSDNSTTAPAKDEEKDKKAKQSRREVLQKVNRTVIYQKNLDLTSMVIEKLNEKGDVSVDRCEKCGQEISPIQR